MGSTRLPGKVLKSLGDTTILEAQMHRLEKVDVCEHWLVTTKEKDDDLLSVVAKGRGWKVFRGQTLDVLSRYLNVVLSSKIDVVVRCTGDNPMTDPSVVTDMLSEMAADPKLISLRDEEHRSIPIGLVPEVFRVSKLLPLVGKRNLDPFHKANVTSVFLESMSWRPPTFLRGLPDLALMDWRFTVDYPEDLHFINSFVNRLGPDWVNSSAGDILDQMDKSPELRLINGGLRQKSYTEG